MSTRKTGFTLVEVMTSITIITVVILGATSVLRNQIDVVGHVANNDYTAAPAQSALWRIRNELLSAVQNPPGLTNATAPSYSVVSPDGSTFTFSSITWRPVIGFISPSDPNYAAFSAQGRISSNNILYDSVAKVLWVDTATFAPINVLKLDTVSGPTGSTVLRSEIIAGNGPAKMNVTDFRLYDAESTANFPWTSSGTPGVNYAKGATNTTFLIGVYLRVEHKSVNPNDRGANMTSNTDNSTATARDLGMAILVAPETFSSGSSGKPFVGP